MFQVQRVGSTANLSFSDECHRYKPVIKDHRDKIEWALNKNRRTNIYYHVHHVGPGKYVARAGKFLPLKRYHSFDITIDKKSVIVHSTVPGGGILSGGSLGMHRNRDETHAVRRRLHAAFPTRSINGKQIWGGPCQLPIILWVERSSHIINPCLPTYLCSYNRVHGEVAITCTQNVCRLLCTSLSVSQLVTTYCKIGII